jgi:hypothetical protein
LKLAIFIEAALRAQAVGRLLGPIVLALFVAVINTGCVGVASSKNQPTNLTSPSPLVSDAPSVDQYGGLTALPSPNGGTGHWRVEKFDNRWLFVDPLGNGFWMLGVQNIDPTTDSHNVYETTVQNKYGDYAKWGGYAILRLKQWNFNTVSDYAIRYVIPWDSSRSGKAVLPATTLDSNTRHSFTNAGNYGTGPVKDLYLGLNGTYTGYRGSFPDVFDPNFANYVNANLKAGAADPYWGQQFTSPWFIVYSPDDADYLTGFGPGAQVPTPDGAIHPHLGWIVLCTNPTQSVGHGIIYSDTTVYSKRSLQTFLSTSYSGSISALNAAWGSNYTTFGSAGGYGSGTGLMDEDGRHTTWLGTENGYLTTSYGTSSRVVADLDAFLYELAVQYFSTIENAFRRYAPNVLLMSPNTLNSHGGLTRRQILQAAGQYCDVLNAGIRTQQILDLTEQYAGDLPIVTWEGFPANPDSDLFSYPLADSSKTQADRAANYVSRLNFLLNSHVTSSRIYPVIGIKWWAWLDSWGEKTNWGLVSFHDNAYDGQQAVMIATKDIWGFSRGGEERNYGDFVSAVRNSNLRIIQIIATGKTQ